MNNRCSIPCVAVALLIGAQAQAIDLIVHQDGSLTELSLAGGAPFHSTSAEVTAASLIEIPGSTALLALWDEGLPNGEVSPYYAVSRNGTDFIPARRTSYEIRLLYADFEPLSAAPDAGVRWPHARARRFDTGPRHGARG